MIHVHSGEDVALGFPSPDVYFLPEYGRAAGLADAGEWVLFEAHGGAWQVPVIVRTLEDGAKDAISPVYTGIFASPSLSSQQVRQAWSETVDCLRARDVISVVLRQSPFLPQVPDLLPDHPELRSIASGRPTILLEPTNSESAWSGMVGTCRTRVRKALKNGYTGSIRPATDHDLLPHGDFRRVYEQTMQRIDAVRLFFFDDEYYKVLLDGLGPNLLLAEVRDRAGVVVASALILRDEHCLHYHLTGSNMDDARMGVNNLMLWTATQHAIEQGIHQFHLGGGNSPRDSLFHFKHTFGGRELEYGVSGQIIDHDRYEAHTQKRAKACGVSTAELLASNFFPSYRAHVAPAVEDTDSPQAQDPPADQQASRLDGHV
jgi:hypothetical protein